MHDLDVLILRVGLKDTLVKVVLDEQVFRGGEVTLDCLPATYGGQAAGGKELHTMIRNTSRGERK